MGCVVRCHDLSFRLEATSDSFVKNCYLIDRSPILKEGSKFKKLSKMPTFLSSTIFHALVSKNSIYCRGKNGLFSVICRLIRQVCSGATIVAPNLFLTSQNHFERSKELQKVRNIRPSHLF